MASAVAGPEGPQLVRGRHLLLRTLDDDTVETLNDGAILHRDGAIVAIGPFSELAAAFPDAPVLGDADSLVIPGLVDAHHHIGMTPIQMGSPDLPLELWLTHQMRHRSIDPYLDTLYSGFELVASGVTAVQHLGRMRPAPVSAWPEEARSVLAAYRDLGMRVSYAFCNRDQHRLVYEDDDIFLATLPEPLQSDARSFLKRTHFRLEDFETEYLRPMLEEVAGSGNRLSKLWLAPINLERASDRLLGLTSEWARKYGLGIHLHLAETIYQKAFALRRFGKSSVEHLADIGFLGPHLTLGHGTWLTEGDLDLIHDHGVCICHNASSNLRLRSGIAPLQAFLERQIPVALGIDEAGLNDDRDMLQEMRLVKHLHAVPGLYEKTASPAQIFRMATENGARAIGFGDEIGTLAVGKRADMVILDYKMMTEPHTSAAHAPVDVLIHRAKTSHVRCTIIEGRMVYRDGAFSFVDRQSVITAIAEQLSRPSTSDEDARANLSERLLPHLKAFYEDWAVPKTEPYYRLNSRI